MLEPHGGDKIGKSRDEYYYDKETGEIYVKPMGGAGPGEWTGVNINER